MNKFDKIVGFVLIAITAVLVAKRSLPEMNLLPGRDPLPATLKPLADSLVAAMPYNTQQEDAAILQGLTAAVATVLENDGRSDMYAVSDRAALKDRMLKMGELVIGPDWSIGQRYPDLPRIMAGHLDSIQEFPAGRAEASTKLRELSICFADIACR